MKKKILSILTVLAVILSLFVFTACGDEDDSSSKKTSKKEKEEIVGDEAIVELMAEDEAEELLKKYYDIAENMYYLCFDELNIDYNDNGVTKYRIKNYEEVMEKYFSEDFRDEFYPALLLKENGKFYLGFGGFAEYKTDMKYTNIEVSENMISCIVKYDVRVPEDEIIEAGAKSKFVLVKEDDEWKIDHYSYESEDVSSNDKTENKSSNKTESNVQVMKDTLLDEDWVKENLYLKTNAFGETIPSRTEQVLTYNHHKAADGTVYVFVQAEVDDELSKGVTAVTYKNGNYVVEKFDGGLGAHQSHVIFKTNENKLMYEYAHMGYCFATLYKINSDGIFKLEDELDEVESMDYSELDDFEGNTRYETIETSFDNISSIIK